MFMHSCVVCVTILSTHGKFRPVSELHALTLAAHSYALMDLSATVVVPMTPHRSLLILYDTNCYYLWLTLVVNYYFLKCILGRRITGDVWYRNTP